MNQREERLIGFDLIRAFAIFFVFLGHILEKQCHNEFVLLVSRSISPGLTMSALGFISGYLLSSKYDVFDGSFYIKRFSRIYSSLFVCLLSITILHIYLSYDLINHHSIIHYMGLSFFMQLLQVTNQSSLGSGLWFVTIIVGLYLLLPIITKIYRHKNSILHLALIIIICVFFDKVMHNTTSSWNVIMAFNIGCYIAIKSNMELLSKNSIFFYTLMTLFILLVCGLATSKILPWGTREFLLPLYPFFAVPLLYKLGGSISGYPRLIISWFSSISYEFYILHFYFINQKFSDLFPSIDSIYYMIFLSFIIITPLAFILSKIGAFLSRKVINYILPFSEKRNDIFQGDSVNN
jgi:peptidoglycan/LPS O-acetylase OafA/YrhL